MEIETSAQETNDLKAIFERHKNDRICVLGTTYCGKDPLFTSIIVDCDVIVYLDISDVLLAEPARREGTVLRT